MSGPYRTLRRPRWGWAFRTWSREVIAWLQAAFMVLASWAMGNTMLAMIEFIAKSQE